MRERSEGGENEEVEVSEGWREDRKEEEERENRSEGGRLRGRAKKEEGQGR